MLPTDFFNKNLFTFKDFNITNTMQTTYYFIKPELEILIRDTIVYFCNYIYMAFACDIKTKTSLAVILSMCTNLRMSELLQLEPKHLQDIVDGKSIPIKIKKRQTSVHLLTNKHLFLHFLPYIYKFSGKVYIITASKSAINQCFRNKLKSIDQQQILGNNKLGIQSVRRVNTTELLYQKLNPKLVQLFNRHKNISTTMENYNTMFGASASISAVYK
jgi:hypothetical protein